MRKSQSKFYYRNRIIISSHGTVSDLLPICIWYVITASRQFELLTQSITERISGDQNESQLNINEISLKRVNNNNNNKQINRLPRKILK